jgi:UDP-N-acetylmuramoyl-tripeptide--D-alanyl-D-alanine ligase
MCIKKLIFLQKKPKVIIVGGEGSSFASSAIFQVLKKFFRVGKIKERVGFEDILKNEILIFDFKKEDLSKKFKFFLKKSALPILVVTNLGEIPPKDVIFASEKSTGIEKLARILPPFGYLILNFDDETVRGIGDSLNVYSLNFGLGEGADLRATDCHFTKDGTTFKLNFKGNILPVWLPNLFGKKNIYAALAGLSIAQVFNLNLVEASQILRNWQGIEGEGKIIEGIKASLVLDDSKNASVFSMIEAVEILGEIGKEREGRKIAVLGDILGIGKYTIEAHEAIGEEVVNNADILFTVGQRAKFIAEGARVRGMNSEKIFEFDETSQVIPVLKNELREGDLILVDGSTEMKMTEIVKEIRRI